MDAHAAGAESARRRVRRASGLLREAARDLAALTEGLESLGTQHAHDLESINAARDLISLGVARHGAVDVVVIARPRSRARNTSTTAADAAKENTHGIKSDEAAGAA